MRCVLITCCIYIASWVINIIVDLYVNINIIIDLYVNVSKR